MSKWSQLAANLVGGAVAALVVIVASGLGAADKPAEEGLKIPFETTERAVSAAEVPEKARRALQLLAREAVIEAYEHERRGDADHYEAEWTPIGGLTQEATVTADGELVETEIDVPAEGVPQAVRQAIQKRLGQRPVQYSRRVFITYEAEFEDNGQPVELTLWPTGQVLQEERAPAKEADRQ